MPLEAGFVEGWFRSQSTGHPRKLRPEGRTGFSHLKLLIIEAVETPQIFPRQKTALGVP